MDNLNFSTLSLFLTVLGSGARQLELIMIASLSLRYGFYNQTCCRWLLHFSILSIAILVQLYFACLMFRYSDVVMNPGGVIRYCCFLLVACASTKVSSPLLCLSYMYWILVDLFWSFVTRFRFIEVCLTFGRVWRFHAYCTYIDSRGGGLGVSLPFGWACDRLKSYYVFIWLNWDSRFL